RSFSGQYLHRKPETLTWIAVFLIIYKPYHTNLFLPRRNQTNRSFEIPFSHTWRFSPPGRSESAFSSHYFAPCGYTGPSVLLPDPALCTAAARPVQAASSFPPVDSTAVHFGKIRL